MSSYFSGHLISQYNLHWKRSEKSSVTMIVCDQACAYDLCNIVSVNLLLKMALQYFWFSHEVE